MWRYFQNTNKAKGLTIKRDIEFGTVLLHSKYRSILLYYYIDSLINNLRILY